jgi:hypothetical protein
MMRHFTAISAGPGIAELAGMRGRVLAVLSNAVYLRSEGGHIAGIAGQAAEDGPFTLRVGKIGLLLQQLKGRENAAFASTQSFIEVVGIARLELDRARQWRGRLPTTIAAVNERVGAVRVLLGLLEGSRCGQPCGLASYLYGAHRSLPLLREVPLLRTNSATGDTLMRRLADRLTGFQEAASELDVAAALEALVSLLGLGIGLTPSGDDIVAGILASLMWQARLGAVPDDFVQRLVQAGRNAAPGRTNDISVRLLWHAGNGLLYAPAMELGAALLGGYVTSLAASARRLLSIGHSSGADMVTGLLAGIVAGIEIESRREARQADKSAGYSYEARLRGLGLAPSW